MRNRHNYLHFDRELTIRWTTGVGIIYYCLKWATLLLSEKLGFEGFRSGEYGSPPSFVYWIRQLVVYVSCLTVMKLVVVGLFALWPGVFKIGEWLLSWLRNKDAAQVILQVAFLSPPHFVALIPGTKCYGFIPNHHEHTPVLVDRLHRQSPRPTGRID